ncbi:glycoside hydrolase family 13 protein [Nocardioides terrisoli]|uniref:glycoside hydrolase family 13 protein n=1 Tax=Nocardioides terrisoli TaxID=3388267 RepID=UPI00287B9156|nr:glycoside hydrolase family 13 protein [Nocardioides marmorisolisilvae]
MTTPAPWWRDAVVYEVYVRSFASTGDTGMGDLRGVAERLPYLVDLGVDAVWLTPFYPSPQHDNGYDVADYRDVDSRFGSLADFDTLLARAHGLGLRVLVDLVPNHTSSDHPWFREALAAGPGSPERARYLFRDKPNNWLSVFGGSAWQRTDDGQYYLHLFDRSQPDLDWTDDDVHTLFDEVLRFWLDRGVDGFRVDVAHGLRKAAGLPDAADPVAAQSGLVTGPMWDQPEVHDIYRRWHRILGEYDGDRMAVAEAWAATPARTMAYCRHDELSQSFNFHWLEAPWSVAAFREVVRETLVEVARVDASPTWVLSNHDVVRHVTRYGGGARGLARGSAATLTMLALPGSAYLYQGEELGLEQVDVPPADRQDPEFHNGRGPGRDGCRVPLPWSGHESPFGNGTGRPWLPQPPEWATLTVEAQRNDPSSTWSFYRRALAARRGLPQATEVTLVDLGPDVFAFRRGQVLVVLNGGDDPLPIPAGEVLISSAPIENDTLPANAGVWLAAPAS